jgi:endoglucanase
VIGQQSVTVYVANGSATQAPALSSPNLVTIAPADTASSSTPIAAASTTIIISSTNNTTAAKATAVATSASSMLITAATNTVVTAALAPVIQPVVQIASSILSVSGTQLYVAANSDAAAQQVQWQENNPSGAQAMATLAAQPTASWFGEWNSDVQSDVHALVSAAQGKGATPVLVAYNIPQRDCGGFSAGGSDNPSGYASWIGSFAAGIGNAPAIVILEPDALADISCLSAADQKTRLQLLNNAVTTLKHDPNVKVYIDAGHSNWIDATTMAQELNKAGVGQADGFSLNVSNFMATSNEIAYGSAISALESGKHFVIDTSRNGAGSTGQWCNPTGMAIGQLPTTTTGNPLVDAYLWVKTPGESDGACNGGPSAGIWWPQYALSLVQNAH